MPIYSQNKFLQVRRAASGLGVFSKKDFSQGSFIIEYTGELLTTQQADQRGGKYLFRIDSKWAVDGKGRENLSRYINHFCRPNCEVQISRRLILIYALKDIVKGEELGYDYGKEYFLTHIKPKGCKCPYCLMKNKVEQK